MWMLEATFRGMTQKQMAEELGVSVDTVKRELTRALSKGYAEKLRERLRTVAEKAPGVHETILDADPKHLQDLSRGYKLKLDAANALLNGLGGFRQESHSTKETLSLHAVAAELAPPQSEPKARIAFQPETVDGEVVSTSKDAPSE